MEGLIILGLSVERPEIYKLAQDLDGEELVLFLRGNNVILPQTGEAAIMAKSQGFYVSEDGKVIHSDGYEAPNMEGGYSKNYPVFRFYHRMYGKDTRIMKHKFAGYFFMGLDALFLQVRHLDNNKLNNSRENLCLGDPGQNARDKPVIERKRIAQAGAIASANKNSKFTPEQVRDLRKWYEDNLITVTCLPFGLMSEKARELGTSITTLKKALNFRYKHVQDPTKVEIQGPQINHFIRSPLEP